MAKTNFQSADEYLATLDAPIRRVLTRVRAVIKKALPEAVEEISYQIPVFKIDGARVIYFAGWREHFSIYPIGRRVALELAAELEPYQTGKGTLRFALDEPVPTKLIARIAKLRAAEEAERIAGKSTAASARRTKAPARQKKRRAAR